jgi:hypothetical protein
MISMRNQKINFIQPAVGFEGAACYENLTSAETATPSANTPQRIMKVELNCKFGFTLFNNYHLQTFLFLKK